MPHGLALVLRAALWRTISERATERPEGSYTTKLLEEGVPAVARKVGEEAVEMMVAAFAETDERLVSESADLIYHLYVLLAARGIDGGAVEDELARRARVARKGFVTMSTITSSSIATSARAISRICEMAALVSGSFTPLAASSDALLARGASTAIRSRMS